MKNTYKILVGKRGGKIPLGNQGRVIIIRTINEYDVRMWTGFI
jgi:hypothetical protein